MAELEKERVKLAKKDRAEANGLLDAVYAHDVPRVTHLLAIGVNPDAVVDYLYKRPCTVKEGYPDGASALSIAIFRGNTRTARLLYKAGANIEIAVGEDKMTPLLVAAVTRSSPIPIAVHSKHYTLHKRTRCYAVRWSCVISEISSAISSVGYTFAAAAVAPAVVPRNSSAPLRLA